MSATALRPVAEALILICELATKLGVMRISNFQAGWAHQVDDDWKVTVNGTRAPIDLGWLELEPFTALIEYRGSTAAVVHPYGGQFIKFDGGGEDAFCDAVKTAIKKVEAGSNPPGDLL
jgi:hypothetical protein